MFLRGDKFQSRFNDYWHKAQDGKYLENHYLDPRNSDPIQDRIELDTDSRTSIEYLKELINMCDKVRTENGLDSIK